MCLIQLHTFFGVFRISAKLRESYERMLMWIPLWKCVGKMNPNNTSNSGCCPTFLYSKEKWNWYQLKSFLSFSPASYSLLERHKGLGGRNQMALCTCQECQDTEAKQSCSCGLNTQETVSACMRVPVCACVCACMSVCGRCAELLHGLLLSHILPDLADAGHFV